MKLASGSGDLSELDQTSFFAQGQEYLDAGDLRDSVLKLLLVERRTHPYAVVRAAELRRWVDSGEYTAILGGDYPRREDDADASMSDAAKKAADSYTEVFRSSQDALGKLVHDLAGCRRECEGLDRREVPPWRRRRRHAVAETGGSPWRCQGPAGRCAGNLDQTESGRPRLLTHRPRGACERELVAAGLAVRRQPGPRPIGPSEVAGSPPTRAREREPAIRRARRWPRRSTGSGGRTRRGGSPPCGRCR